MKIAVNKCYGGFSLSYDAMKRLSELKGYKIYCYRQTKYNYKDGIDEYKKIDIPNKNDLFIYYFSEDLGETTNELRGQLLSQSDIIRNDPDLIQVIEELGNKANGKCANIRVVDIPDDINWEIEEYDGSEWISECHRTW